MRTFLTKKLPAFLLAMILVVGMVPAALAEGETTNPPDPPADHKWSTEWSKNSTKHWHACEDCDEREDEADHNFRETSRKEPTCYQDGTLIETCDVCGYTIETKLPKTDDHIYSDSWSSDGEYHWHACTTKGCPSTDGKVRHTPRDNGIVTEPTCTESGYISHTCDVCGKAYTVKTSGASGHNYVDGKCSRCGATDNTKVTVTFKNGSSTHSTQDVSKGGSPKKPTNPTMSETNKTFTFKGWISGSSTKAVYTGQSLVDVATTTVSKATTYSAVYTVRATSQNSSISVDGDTDGYKISDLRTAINNKFSAVTGQSFETVKLSSLSSSTYGRLYTSSTLKTAVSTSSSYSYSSAGNFYFVPTSKDTFSVGYTATDSAGNSVSGTITLNVGSSTSGSTITYKVSAGKSVDFKKSDFQAAYREEYSSGTITHVEFSTSASISTSSGTVYFDYDGSDEKAFTKSNIDNYAFYYSSSSKGDYALDSLSYVAPKGAKSQTIKLNYTAYASSSKYVEGVVEIKVGGGSGSSGDTITYKVDPGDYVNFKKSDFEDVYEEELSGTIRYVTFKTSDALSTSDGTVYYNYDGSGEKAFTKSNIDDYQFYYSSKSYGDYALANLSFAAPKNADERTVELDFRIYDSDDDYVSGTVEIEIGKGSSSKGDITYTVAPGKTVDFDRSDFNDYYQDEKDTNNTVKWVTFETSSTLNSTNGTVYFDYDGKDEKSFTKSTIEDFKFYYSSSSNGDYALNNLTFVAGKSFTTEVKLDFRAYYSASSYADGTLVIKPTGSAVTAGKGDIRYSTAYGANVQINPNDIARYLQASYPSSTLQYVTLGGVPSTGSLYYNNYGASKYGTSKLKLTSSNCDNQNFYFSPSSTSQYALSELTYIPSGVNYCVTIPFTAYGSSSRSVSGNILISVNLSAVPDVYGVTPKGDSVNFPASAIYSAVAGSTGVSLASIQLLSLPASSVGTVYYGTGSTKANTSTLYTYSSQINQLRFVPASSFTGSVEIPYLAYNSGGSVIASGTFSLGVVKSVKKFSDMGSSTWCYKYVIELSDAGVIDGYKDGKFKETRNVTYGEALKLIMLAAGYSEQKATGTHWASGYLSKAKADNLISGNVNLDAPITRLAVAQIAAKAMKLSTSNLSSIKPFTDTSDVYVQALNAAGIVEGYFSNGTSTYKPGNYLTRGHISAIVWRMERSK